MTIYKKSTESQLFLYGSLRGLKKTSLTQYIIADIGEVNLTGTQNASKVLIS